MIGRWGSRRQGGLERGLSTCRPGMYEVLVRDMG